ncbi:MAG TPA: phosphoribosylaminoimidazolesuccinocarboxamide synthase [Blastocatellia bacterium]|nr:phosphoribosylaminoimidazolesuccinocarboxamide synthase [Blastocatellia bacterium]
MTINPITETSLPDLTLFRRGKVRDIYAVEDRLLIVATDRLSAFDVVLPNPIPMKGVVLTQLSLFWFDYLKGIVANHLISARVEDYPAPLAGFREPLAGRSMLVHRAEVFPVECVARGYLAGSGWKDYQQSGAVCGIKLPPGLKESAQLPEPIFTPATKAESGHDLNISERETANLIGEEATAKLKALTLDIYARASSYAAERGIIIADTKFEFGVKDGEVILVDEALTPDSSRFWPAARYEPGHSQPSFDKQFVRDYLETLDWNKQPPGPVLPDEVVARTRDKYLEAYRLLTGHELAQSA